MSLLRGAIYGVVIALAGCSVAESPAKFLLLVMALNVTELLSTVKR